MKDFYGILGVELTATADEIKRAYRRLASQHHPDKGGDTARFQEIEEAYRVLSDPAQRTRYDRTQASPGSSAYGFDFSGMNLHDIFANFGAAAPFGRQSAHVKVTVWIDLCDVLQGGTRTITVSTNAGQTTVNVGIPQGIQDGDHVQYAGMAPNGVNLVVQYRVRPDSRWQRQGQNLLTEHEVSIWQLIEGADIDLTDAGNTVLLLTIPPRTNPGTVLRLRGRGVPTPQGTAGDALVRLQARIPPNIPQPVLDAIRQHC